MTNAFANRARQLLGTGINGKSKESDYVFITFILDHLPHGVIGLLVTVGSGLVLYAIEDNAGPLAGIVTGAPAQGSAPLVGEEGERSTERAISFVATVISDLCRQGGGWMVLGTAAESYQIFRGPPSTALLRECLLHLATLEAKPAETFEPMLQDLIAGLRPDTRIVVVTARGKADDASTAMKQTWMGPGDRPMQQPLVIDAAGDQLSKFFESDARVEGAT